MKTQTQRGYQNALRIIKSSTDRARDKVLKWRPPDKALLYSQRLAALITTSDCWQRYNAGYSLVETAVLARTLLELCQLIPAENVLQFFKYRKTTKRFIKFESRGLRCGWLPLAVCQGAGEPGTACCPPWAQSRNQAEQFKRVSPLQLQPHEDHAAGGQGRGEERGAVLIV